MVDGKSRYLGLYADEGDAGRAYDLAAVDAWGKFARLNFPGRINEPPPARWASQRKARTQQIIEALARHPERSQKSIAEEFGVSQPTVSYIKKHAGDE